MVTWFTFFLAISLSTKTILAQKSQFAAPEAKIEALKSGGFRAYIPHVSGITFFAFHANINDKIVLQDPGTISGEAKRATGDYWVVEFPQTKLQVGDIVNYWIFITHNRLGYRRDELSSTIKELLDQYSVLYAKCVRASTTKDGGKETCVGDIIIEDNFEGQSVDQQEWSVEHKILTYNFPSYEFNSFENSDDTRYVRNGILYLKPIIRESEQDVRGILDLRQGCTSTMQSQCYHRSASAFILPPVKSAKLISKTSFMYGKIEIRAKLPEGEWLFSNVELEPKIKENAENSSKIWIAYSRGNDHLTGRSQDDIGSRLLFAGPVLQPTEPIRSRKLISKKSNDPFYNDFHIYALEWKPGRMTFSIDSSEYGSVDTSRGFVDSSWGLGPNWYNEPTPLDKEHVLSLGVSVGGFNDFPDGYMSGIHPKPWLNTDYRNLVRKFFDARGAWSNTWSNERPALQVDYVKVTAI